MAIPQEERLPLFGGRKDVATQLKATTKERTLEKPHLQGALNPAPAEGGPQRGSTDGCDDDLRGKRAPQDGLRVVVFSPLFPEYATRLAAALGRHAKVLLVADREGFEAECRSIRLEGRGPSGMERRLHRLFLRRSGAPAALQGLVRALVDMWRFKPDIIHFQECPNAAHYLLVLLMKRRARLVVTVHDPRPHSGRDFCFDRPRTRARIRASADLLLAHGKECADEVARSAGAEGTSVYETTHGVVLCPPPGLLRNPVPGRILFFGRMEAYKGLSVLLAAAELLAEREVPFSLRLAGKGPELDRLSARYARMRWLTIAEGFLSPLEAITELQEASLVALPYLDATQSGVTAAAFANGRPVVASRVGGLVDVVIDGTNGLLVKPGDPSSLADALERALSHGELLNRLRRGAERTATTLMNWDHIAVQILDRYQSLLTLPAQDLSDQDAA